MWSGLSVSKDSPQVLEITHTGRTLSTRKYETLQNPTHIPWKGIQVYSTELNSSGNSDSVKRVPEHHDTHMQDDKAHQSNSSVYSAPVCQRRLSASESRNSQISNYSSFQKRMHNTDILAWHPPSVSSNCLSISQPSLCHSLDKECTNSDCMTDESILEPNPLQIPNFISLQKAEQLTQCNGASSQPAEHNLNIKSSLFANSHFLMCKKTEENASSQPYASILFDSRDIDLKSSLLTDSHNQESDIFDSSANQNTNLLAHPTSSNLTSKPYLHPNILANSFDAKNGRKAKQFNNSHYFSARSEVSLSESGGSGGIQKYQKLLEKQVLSSVHSTPTQAVSTEANTQCTSLQDFTRSEEEQSPTSDWAFPSHQESQVSNSYMVPKASKHSYVRLHLHQTNSPVNLNENQGSNFKSEVKTASQELTKEKLKPLNTDSYSTKFAEPSNFMTHSTTFKNFNSSSIKIEMPCQEPDESSFNESEKSSARSSKSASVDGLKTTPFFGNPDSYEHKTMHISTPLSRSTHAPRGNTALYTFSKEQTPSIQIQPFPAAPRFSAEYSKTTVDTNVSLNDVKKSGVRFKKPDHSIDTAKLPIHLSQKNLSLISENNDLVARHSRTSASTTATEDISGTNLSGSSGLSNSNDTTSSKCQVMSKEMALPIYSSVDRNSEIDTTTKNSDAYTVDTSRIPAVSLRTRQGFFKISKEGDLIYSFCARSELKQFYNGLNNLSVSNCLSQDNKLCKTELNFVVEPGGRFVRIETPQTRNILQRYHRRDLSARNELRYKYAYDITEVLRSHSVSVILNLKQLGAFYLMSNLPQPNFLGIFTESFTSIQSIEMTQDNVTFNTKSETTLIFPVQEFLFLFQTTDSKFPDNNFGHFKQLMPKDLNVSVNEVLKSESTPSLLTFQPKNNNLFNCHSETHKDMLRKVAEKATMAHIHLDVLVEAWIRCMKIYQRCIQLQKSAFQKYMDALKEKTDEMLLQNLCMEEVDCDTKDLNNFCNSSFLTYRNQTYNLFFPIVVEE